jgi:hypothetical protein
MTPKAKPARASVTLTGADDDALAALGI